MKVKVLKLFYSLLMLMFFGTALAYGQKYREEFVRYEKDFVHPEIYKARREKVIQLMEPNSVAVFKTATKKLRTSDMEYIYKQSPNFQYLTGCLEDNSFLILLSEEIEIDGKKTKEILFVNENPPSAVAFLGKSFGTEGTKDILRFDVSYPVMQIAKLFPQIIGGKKNLYLTQIEGIREYDYLTGMSVRTFTEFSNAIKKKYPDIAIKTDLERKVINMRLVKDKVEIDYLRKAVEASGKGLARVAKNCKPGLYEYEMQAEYEYGVKKEGAETFGFPSIVCSGPNTNIFHYDANRRKMENGELLSLDVGAEYHGYSTDITRVYPVNGKFTKEQKEIYELVLKTNRETIKAVKPGVTWAKLDSIARNILADGLFKMGLIKNKKEYIDKYPHPVGHDIGLEPHDSFGYTRPLLAGQVLAIEPGAYIFEDTPGVDKAFWNIGIRIEDDVLITENGCEVLSAKIPKTIEEIEKLMKKK